MFSDWVLFLTYPNLFEIKDFIVVITIQLTRTQVFCSKAMHINLIFHGSILGVAQTSH
jgi:hypothetical protein